MINLTTSKEQIIKDLKLESLPFEEQEQILEEMQDHFGKIITQIMLTKLTPEQFESFKNALVLEDEADQQAQIAAIASEVPGLAEEIDARIGEEYALMKSAVE